VESAATHREVANRGLLVVSVMLATLMQALDTTIANVALPNMQGTLSATQDQISWVLTSYIVAAAIATPATGWLASVMGRRRLLLIAITGFTIASVLCGSAPRSCRCRSRPCSTCTRARSTARRWRCGAWA
jgi:DHA2 family multidrug resistance protein